MFEYITPASYEEYKDALAALHEAYYQNDEELRLETIFEEIRLLGEVLVGLMSYEEFCYTLDIDERPYEGLWGLEL